MDETTKADMQLRTPKGWYGLATPVGWDNLVRAAHEKLLLLDPNYEIHQIKEKFGSLRYYCSLNTPEAEAIIREAETLSCTTCQRCGASDASYHHQEGKYLVATLCHLCIEDDQSCD